MDPRSAHARYDEQGNIILSVTSKPAVSEALHFDDVESPSIDFASNPSVDGIVWGLPEDPIEDISEIPAVDRTIPVKRIATQLNVVRESCASALEEAEREVLSVARDAVAEGERQIAVSMRNGRATTRDVWEELKLSLRSLGAMLTQPVIVPGRRAPKQYSRGVLFLLDIGRFGGTFAAIFVMLFSAMNYQSFSTIAAAKIEPLIAFLNLDTAQAAEKSLAEKLRQVPSLPTAGGNDSGLARLLPPVGPPQDLLIIPSLRLQAPVIGPATDSLLSEDWKQLETDIQHALESGVVHYPGTASPGQAGNVFITGHSSYFPWAVGDYKSIFARLGELNVGDEFWIYSGGDKHRYTIETKKEITPSDVTVLDQPVQKRIATLMTCTPVGTTLRRLILVAQEVDPITGEALEVGEHQKVERPEINIEALPI